MFAIAVFTLLGAAASGCGGTDNVDVSSGPDAAASGSDSGGGTGGFGADATTSTSDGGVTTTPDATTAGDGDATVDPGRDGSVDNGPFGTAGASTTVTAFDGTLVCFGNGGTGPCSRTVDKAVTFPSTGAFKKIAMHVTLNCPTNGCDPWDRVGSIYLVKPGVASTDPETLVELGRFMTPYGIRAGVNSPPAWDIDVTELRPLLVGTVTLRVFIDTWVPQGNAAAYGGGWVVGTKFDMTGGFATKAPIVALPIATWKTTGKEPMQVVYGDSQKPIATSLPPQTIDLPAGPTAWSIRSTITGHGQANLENCAEFCSKSHSWSVNGTENKKAMWRTDCANFKSSGTYQYSRAGWCPGADVLPWDFDITAQVAGGTKATIAYGVEAYTNTCNQGAPNGGLCTGCPSGVSCDYNGGSHTQPFYFVSSVLIGYR